MKWNSHLWLNGQCEAAFQLYEGFLGGKNHNQAYPGRFADGGAGATGLGRQNSTCDSHVGGNVLTGADLPPQQYQPPKGFYMQLNIDDPAEAERIFHTLTEKRNGASADPKDFLGGLLWRPCRPVRHTLGDHLRTGKVG
jgi:PhnB protein